MEEKFFDIRRNINTFLTIFRRSIERQLRTRLPIPVEEREKFMRSMLIVEEARIRFDLYIRYHEGITRKSEWIAVRKELLLFVDNFFHSEFVDAGVYDSPFMSGSLISRDKGNSSVFVQGFIDRNRRTTLADALFEFRSYLEDVDVEFLDTQQSLFLNDIENIVPRQQVAPVQFDIVDGRIVVARRLPKTIEVDRANIRSALEHIIGSGERLINSLANSNCDRRLFESVTELHSQLESDENIVKIGLMNMACSVMGAQFQAELPDAIAGMFYAYNASISLYVAQFPEWEQFTQKAAAVDFGDSDVSEIDAVTGNIIDVLSQDEGLVDPEVPKTISFIRQFLAFPGASSKRAAFAMIRTIENLISSIVRHSLSFANKTAEGVADSGSKAASKVIVGLLSLALMSASGIGPAAMRAGAPWVKQAAEMVQRQIEKMQ